MLSNPEVRAQARALLQKALADENRARKQTARFLHQVYVRLRPYRSARFFGRLVCRVVFFVTYPNKKTLLGCAHNIKVVSNAIRELDRGYTEPAKAVLKEYAYIAQSNMVFAHLDNPVPYYEVAPIAKQYVGVADQL